MYFSVDKFSDYGRLSGRKLEDNRAGERVAVDSRKKNPADFALWKVSVRNSWCTFTDFTFATSNQQNLIKLTAYVYPSYCSCL